MIRNADVLDSGLLKDTLPTDSYDTGTASADASGGYVSVTLDDGTTAVCTAACDVCSGDRVLTLLHGRERIAVCVVKANAEYVTTGVDGDWYYTKYSNGKMVAKRTVTVSLATTTVWAAPIYFGSVSLSIPAGMFDVAPPHVNVTVQNSLLAWQIGTYAKSATDITVYFARAANTTANVTFTIALEGTWKA